MQTFTINFSLAGYHDKSLLAVCDRIAERVRSLPGVRAAVYSWSLPLDGSSRSLGGLEIPGRQPPAGMRLFTADWNVISRGYFSTLRIPLVQGRDFTAGDQEGAPGVVIINETMAQRFWPGENPVGREIYAGGVGEDRRPQRIVGVARTHQYRSLAPESLLFVYVPFQQHAMNEMALMVRTDPGVIVQPAVRSVIHEMSPYLPVVSAQSLIEYTRVSLFPQKLAGWVSGSLGILGLLLTCIGIYGTTAFSVAQRTREIGIRMALGADRAIILRMLLFQGTRFILAGIAIGLAAAIAATGLLAPLMIGIGARDPMTFAVIALILVVVSIVAVYVPATRALRADPMNALRTE